MIFNTVRGSIQGAQGRAIYEDGILTAISGSLDINTLKSGNRTRDGHLKKKEEFFNIEKTPRIYFLANDVLFVGKTNGTTTYKLSGSLTLRGVSNEMNLEIKETSKNHLVGTFTVNRDLWGLGEGWSKTIISQDIDVQVDIHLE
jgi:polyisoprenoid-binding protein YceI